MAGKTASVSDIAAGYIAQGINCTPIHGPKAKVSDPGKQPRMEEWQKLRLEAHVFQPGDNLGVVTGHASGLICVDCDKKSGGMTWFAANEARLGQYIRENTPGGGVHLYYRYPQDRQFVPSRGKLFPGVDFLADGGRQVVTWPSVAPSGKAYVFENGLSLLDVPHETEPPPAWLMQENDRAFEAAEARKREAESIAVPDDLTVDSPQEIEIVRDALKSYPAAIEGDGGDERTLRAAMLCRDHLLSQEVAYQVLWEVYNPRCRPPWEPRELRTKVKNAYKYATLPAGTMTAAAAFPESPEELQAAIPEAPAPVTYQLKYPVYSARHFILRNQGKVLCDQGQLYVYNSGRAHWELIDDDRFEAVVLRDIDGESTELACKMKMSQLRDIARAVKRQLDGLVPDLRPDTWLDGRGGHFVSCRNGVLDIGTGELVPHSPDWFSFTTLPFAYNPNATCPGFEEFLSSVWDGDGELKEALQLWMGYVLTSAMTQQKFAVVIGESRAGKSTLARVIEGIVGKKNTEACSLGQFGSDFGLAPLLGKRLAIFNDAQKLPGSAGELATERLISIVGNDPQSVNRKNRDMLTTRMPLKVMLVCNEIPQFVNAREALTRRMIVFPFKKSFHGREDTALGDRLQGELPGILNWALDGARAILGGQKLKQSSAGEEAVEEIAEMLDSVRGFMNDVVRFTSDARAATAFVANTRLFEAYRRWCQDAGVMPKGKKKFLREFASKTEGRVLKEKSLDRNRTRGFLGLYLDEEAAHFDAPSEEVEIPF